MGELSVCWNRNCHAMFVGFLLLVCLTNIGVALVVWNADNNSSYTEICTKDFGVENFSPAYTVDLASRNLIYLHADVFGNIVTQTYALWYSCVKKSY